MRILAKRHALALALLSNAALAVGCSASVDDGASSSSEAMSAVVLPPGPIGPIAPIAGPWVDGSFTVTGLAHKCVDFGGDAYQAVGSPVILYGCNGSSAQRVHVVENSDGTRDVSLRASKGLCFGVNGGAVVAGKALVLQTCDAASPAQRFAVDGDAIYMGTQKSGRVARNLVVEVQQGRSANHTPLVLGARDLDDSEDFRFTTSFTASTFPTSGFTRVFNVTDLNRALASAKWGSVIEVAHGANIVIDDLDERHLPEGVTLRGDRRGMEDGPQINRHSTGGGNFLVVDGNDVRITGLRLRGPDTTMDDDAPLVIGVLAPQDLRVTVDHDEMSAWTSSAVSAEGDFDDDPLCTYPATPVPPENIHVIKNFMHENQRQDGGYGVVSGDGANPLIEGNTFDHNRHAIAADNNGKTHYDAIVNLVTAGNYYCHVPVVDCWKEQDFDVHGEGAPHYTGGRAGGSFLITANSFYSEDKNIDIRGTPCDRVTLEDNVFIEDFDTAISSESQIGEAVASIGDRFSAPRGATFTADFDGDGTQDTFMGTGAAWYYRPGGTKEWRYLRRATQQVADLSFGDFDADGRTDVRWVNPTTHLTMTSWGAITSWDLPIAVVPPGGVTKLTSLE